MLRRSLREIVREAWLRPVPPPLPRGAVDARHLVGHRLGRDAAGLRRRLPRRARRGFPRRVRRRHGRRRFRARPACRPAASAPASACASPSDDVLAIGELPLVKTSARSSCRSSRSSTATSSRATSIRARRRVATARCAAEKPQPGGRFLDDEDVRLHRRVAFIGTEVQRKLFGDIPPVGETIRIGGQPFEVVGVMRGEGAALELQPARQVLRLHPVDDDGRAVGQPATSARSSGRR